MRLIPPGGSIPPGIRAQRRIRASAGIGVASGSRTPRREQSSWDGNIERHVFKHSGTPRSKPSSAYELISVCKRAIEELESEIENLLVFEQEGLEVTEEITRLEERKQSWENQLKRLM